MLNIKKYLQKRDKTYTANHAFENQFAVLCIRFRVPIIVYKIRLVCHHAKKVFYHFVWLPPPAYSIAALTSEYASNELEWPSFHNNVVISCFWLLVKSMVTVWNDCRLLIVKSSYWINQNICRKRWAQTLILNDRWKHFNMTRRYINIKIHDHKTIINKLDRIAANITTAVYSSVSLSWDVRKNT